MEYENDTNLAIGMRIMAEIVATLLSERDQAFQKADHLQHTKNVMQAKLLEENKVQLVEIHKQRDIINKQQARINEIQKEYQQLRDLHRPTGTTTS